jgi:hypothetical protein
LTNYKDISACINNYKDIAAFINKYEDISAFINNYKDISAFIAKCEKNTQQSNTRFLIPNLKTFKISRLIL